MLQESDSFRHYFSQPSPAGCIVTIREASRRGLRPNRAGNSPLTVEVDRISARSYNASRVARRRRHAPAAPARRPVRRLIRTPYRATVSNSDTDAARTYHDGSKHHRTAS